MERMREAEPRPKHDADLASLSAAAVESRRSRRRRRACRASCRRWLGRRRRAGVRRPPMTSSRVRRPAPRRRRRSSRTRVPSLESADPEGHPREGSAGSRSSCRWPRSAACRRSGCLRWRDEGRAGARRQPRTQPRRQGRLRMAQRQARQQLDVRARHRRCRQGPEAHGIGHTHPYANGKENVSFSGEDIFVDRLKEVGSRSTCCSPARRST